MLPLWLLVKHNISVALYGNSVDCIVQYNTLYVSGRLAFSYKDSYGLVKFLDCRLLGQDNVYLYVLYSSENVFGTQIILDIIMEQKHL